MFKKKKVKNLTEMLQGYELIFSKVPENFEVFFVVFDNMNKFSGT